VEDKEPETHLRADSEAMDRLRDRTDELELIISSLTIFALFSVPSWPAPWALRCWLAPASDWPRVSSCT